LEGEAKLMSTLYERITTKSAKVGVIGEEIALLF